MIYYDKDEDFNIDGNNSFFHKRRSNVRSGTRPQKFAKAPEVCTDFYYELEEVFKQFGKNIPDSVVVEGCYDTNKHTLNQQASCRNFTNNVLPDEVAFNEMSTAIRDTIRKLKIRDLGNVSVTDLYDYSFNLDTKPGFRFENYFRAQKKKDCVDLAVKLSIERYNAILEASKSGNYIQRNDIIPGVYTIGARNKREELPENHEVCNSRAVHMPEWHVELHAGLFSDRITTYLKEIATGPIFIGNSFTKFERYEKLLKYNCFAIEGDWSKFDASLCNFFVTSALCICRLYFPHGLVYDNHFLAILDNIVIKDYMLPGGKVLRLLHGVPSGSKFTSLLGSIINLIVLNYSFSTVKYNHRSFAIGGDDFVCFVRNNGYNLTTLEDDVIKKSTYIGMKLKIFKLKQYKHSKDIDDYPVFYKYTVYDGVPIIPVSDLIERIMSPWNKRYKTTSEFLSFLDCVLPSLAHPYCGCYIFYLLYKYVFYRVTKRVLSLHSIISTHYYVYTSLRSLGVEPWTLKGDDLLKRNIVAHDIILSDYAKQVFLLD